MNVPDGFPITCCAAVPKKFCSRVSPKTLDDRMVLLDPSVLRRAAIDTATPSDLNDVGNP